MLRILIAKAQCLRPGIGRVEDETGRGIIPNHRQMQIAKRMAENDRRSNHSRS